MIVALIDNGSLEAAAHLNLRTVAAQLSTRCHLKVHAVSWKHSDLIEPAALGGAAAWTLAAFVRAMTALGQREFVFVPFFISAQGAVGSALRRELEQLQREPRGFDFVFTSGLAAANAIPGIAAARIRETLAAQALSRPAIIVVDHGGPSPASARLRDDLTTRIRSELGGEIGRIAAASMEGHHPPLLADLLHTPGFIDTAVVVAPLFLSPGRHAGPEGDIATICRASRSRCHLTGLLGTHPDAVDSLATALHHSLSDHHTLSFA